MIKWILHSSVQLGKPWIFHLLLPVAEDASNTSQNNCYSRLLNPSNLLMQITIQFWNSLFNTITKQISRSSHFVGHNLILIIFNIREEKSIVYLYWIYCILVLPMRNFRYMNTYKEFSFSILGEESSYIMSMWFFQHPWNSGLASSPDTYVYTKH